MYTKATELQSHLSQNRNFTLSHKHQQLAKDIEMERNLQMSDQNCKNNNQQRRGRRRWADIENLTNFCWAINLGILICLAHNTIAVPTATATDSSSGSVSSNIGSNSNSNSNSNSASSTIVTVAVTPSSISSNSSTSSSLFSSSTESSLEQQQPQGQCLLDGLWVPETTVHCVKQTSCRAIQRTGHCCPDYKCDCERDGKTYANGYKLVDPDTPCTVCYCKGGEIVCSSVTCFRRDDCMPKYVPGRCCPEYDNCPILDNNPPLASETSSILPPTTKPNPIAPPAGFNWNITIKEITKPTEIRITDDNHKFKQAIPIRKESTTTGATTTTTTAAATAAAAATTVDGTAITTASAAAVNIATTDSPASPATSAAGAIATPAAASPSATVATVAISTDSPATPMQSSASSQDTNQKALPANSSESLKLIASVGYIEHPLSPNISNKVGPHKPLVTYNADGLEPLAESDPSKVNIKREYTTVGTPAPDDAEVIGSGSTIIKSVFKDALVDSAASAAELEPDTAGSIHIYHIVSTTEGPKSASTTERQQITSDSLYINEASSTYNYNNNNTLEQLDISTEGVMAASSGSSSEPPISSTTHTLHHMDDDEVPQVEANPAYPSLPEDDFSLRDVNFPLVELEDIVEAESKDESRSIVSAFERDDDKLAKLTTESNLEASGNGSGNGSGDMELISALGSTTEHASASNQDTLVLSQVPLVYSIEDNSAETRIQNMSELAKSSHSQNENDTSAELESGSGSGNGELLREPTTPRIVRVPVVDIDELGSGSGSGQAQGSVPDPKADAESLKLDESQEQSDNVAKANGTGNKATARAEKSFEEQAISGLEQPVERIYLQRIY